VKRGGLERIDWVAGLLLGASLGTVVLGIGGRIAMRGIAQIAGSPGGFSLGGSLTVVFLGLVSGLAGALAFLALRWLVGSRAVLRGILFWAFLTLATLRGLRPLDLQRAVLFFPLVLVFGVAFQVIWCRVYLRRRRSAGGRVAAGSGNAGDPELSGDLRVTRYHHA
jgi:hypothetical protein